MWVDLDAIMIHVYPLILVRNLPLLGNGGHRFLSLAEFLLASQDEGCLCPQRLESNNIAASTGVCQNFRPFLDPAYTGSRHRGLRSMKSPRCCVDSSAFGTASSPAFANTEILTEVSVMMYRRMFVIHAIPVAGESQHASRSLFGLPLISSYKSTLVHPNSPSSYEFFSLIQLFHHHSQCPGINSHQADTSLKLPAQTPRQSSTFADAKVCLPSFSAIVKFTFPPSSAVYREEQGTPSQRVRLCS